MIDGAGGWESEMEPVHQVEKKARVSRRETSPVPKEAVGLLGWDQQWATVALLLLIAMQWFTGPWARCADQGQLSGSPRNASQSTCFCSKTFLVSGIPQEAYCETQQNKMHPGCLGVIRYKKHSYMMENKLLK